MTCANRIVLLLLASVMPLWTGCQDGGVVRLKDQATIPFDQMVGEVSKSRVIVIGETHDNQADHDLQLKIIRTLHEGAAPCRGP